VWHAFAAYFQGLVLFVSQRILEGMTWFLRLRYTFLIFFFLFHLAESQHTRHISVFRRYRSNKRHVKAPTAFLSNILMVFRLVW
jgi:hypothetical protein